MAPPVHRFELPLRILLENLQELRSTGLLESEVIGLVVSGRQISTESRIELVLEKGFVEQCAIFHPRAGAIAQGRDAWLALQPIANKRMAWQFSPQKASRLAQGAFPMIEAASPSLPFPLEARKGSPLPSPLPGVATSPVLAGLPRGLRRVLVLVDGQRSTQQIADLLSLSPEQVHLALSQLHAYQLILYEETNG